MSLQTDFLCMSAKHAPGSLRREIDKLPERRQQALRKMAYEILGGKLPEQQTVRMSPSAPRDDPPQNYVQEIYDRMPMRMKAAGQVLMDIMGPQQTSVTVEGFNLVFRGLGVLGLNVLDIPRLPPPRIVEIPDEPQFTSRRIEDITDDDPDDVD